jgi:hypothetical protein
MSDGFVVAGQRRLTRRIASRIVQQMDDARRDLGGQQSAVGVCRH